MKYRIELEESCNLTTKTFNKQAFELELDMGLWNY